MNKKQILLSTYLGFTALALSSCGGTGQDQGQTSEVDQVFSGVSVDGHLARAMVFIDSNNNGTRDAWEVYAFTDNEGYYSYNPNTNTDYCESDTPSEQIYCLRANTSAKDVVIRVDGGYDILTGEPFVGQLSRRINIESGEHVSDLVVSPISSLLTNVDQNEKGLLLEILDIQEPDLDVDYLNTDGEGAIDTNLLNVALKVHKTVSILSDRLTDTYVDIGEEFGTPNDASSFVYRHLAREILLTDQPLDHLLSDASALNSVLDQSEVELREIYHDRELNLPEDLNSGSDSQAFSRVVSVVAEIPVLINQLIPVDQGSMTKEEAVGAARALETVVIKTFEEDQTIDPSLDNAIEFLTSVENTTLVDTLLDGLSGDNADLTAIINNDFSGDDFDSVEEISEQTTFPDSVLPFLSIGGMSLKVSDLDLGSAPNRLKDSEVEFYFSGESTDVSGEYSACVKFIDEANENGDIGDGNTRGELVSGFWSLLGTNSEDLSSYSLLVTIDFLNTTYQAIVKPYGEAVINNQTYQLIRTDSDGDFRTWHSPEGLMPFSSVPETKADCELRLPSRIGI